MIQMMSAIAAILITWTVLSVSFLGIGRLIWRNLGPSGARNSFDWIVSFWLGYAAVLCFLQFWNFWLPINICALLSVGIAGLLAAAFDGKALLLVLRSCNPRTLLALSLVALWVANRALGPGNADDSGNYHYTVIRWANEYPAIPGLANLSAVYTYNNASLLYAAMLNTGPWAGRGEHITNGLLVIALFAQVISAIFRLLSRRSTSDAGTTLDLFDLVLLIPAVMLTLAKDLPSPKTDLPPGVLTLVMARVALTFILNTGHEEAARRSRWIVILATLAAALVALKLSAGLVAFLLFAIPAWQWISVERPAHLRRALMMCTLAVLMLVGPWVGRNIILNGYPFYPSKALAMPVDWRVSARVVDLVCDHVGQQSKAGMLFWLHDTLERNHLPRYARVVNPPFAKDENPPGLSWVRPWLFSLPISSLIEIVLPAMLCIAALLIAIQRPSPSQSPHLRAQSSTEGKIGLLPLAPLAGLLFWFTTAPDPRFGWAPTWTLAAMLIAWAYTRSFLIHSRRAINLAVIFGLLLIVPTLGYRLVVLTIQKQVQPLHQVPFQYPGPDHGFWPHPTIPFKPVTNRWGLTLNMPVNEDDAMTWGMPLPSAGWKWPPNDPNLRLRNPGNIAAGFKSDPSPN